MRRPRGALLPPVSAARVRRGDVYRTLRSAVLDGTLPSSVRLPSTRQAAADYGVSRGMLEEVFAQLTEEAFFNVPWAGARSSRRRYRGSARR